MSDRYSKLFILPAYLYAAGAPIIVVAGALLKDNKAGKVLAQLKLQNLSDKIIKAVTVKIAPLDTIGQPLGEPVEFQYLDLNAARNAAFGQKTPIPLPDAATRGFHVSVSNVFFADNTVWSSAGTPWEPLSAPVPLEQALGDTELVKQYQLQYGDHCKYRFHEEKDLWRCPCGALNHKDELHCHSCKKEAAAVAVLDLGKLQAGRDERLEMERQMAAEKKAAESVRRKKGRKIAVIFCGVALIVTAALTFTKQVIIPEKQYAQAEALLEARDYEGAAAAFEALGDYKDAAQWVTYGIPYQQADDLAQDGQTAQAAIAFGKLGDYQDAQSRSFDLWGQVTVRDAISAGDSQTTALKTDGTAVVAGSDLPAIKEWDNLVALSSYGDCVLALRLDGTVVATGDNYQGRCEVETWENIVTVATSKSHSFGLKSDGTIVITGDYDNTLFAAEDWTDIVAISAGGYPFRLHPHIVALKIDGTVMAVGDNQFGQCNVKEWTDIVAVSAGGDQTVGLKSDGTVVATGYDYSGECNVEDWTDIIAVAAGNGHTVGLKLDGTVVATGANSWGACDVENWTDIVAVSAGTGYTVGLKSDGTVVTVGQNTNGQCNVGGWTNIKLPD